MSPAEYLEWERTRPSPSGRRRELRARGPTRPTPRVSVVRRRTGGVESQTAPD